MLLPLNFSAFAASSLSHGLEFSLPAIAYGFAAAVRFR